MCVMGGREDALNRRHQARVSRQSGVQRFTGAGPGCREDLLEVRPSPEVQLECAIKGEQMMALQRSGWSLELGPAQG